MSDIPEEALKTIEESFGSRFVPHAVDEAEPHAEQPFASVFGRTGNLSVLTVAR